MKNILRYSSIAVLCSSTVFAADLTYTPQPKTEQVTTQAIPLVTTAMVAKWILDGAKGAITSKAKSFLGGLLFGNANDTGPQIVRIHHDDLQAIANLVSTAILNSDVHDAKSQLDSFATVLEYYRDSVRGGNTDYAILPVLLNYTTSLSNHRAYKPEYNSTAYSLTASYALVSSFTIAVLTERHLQGYISLGLVKDQAQQLKLKLTALGAKTDQYAYGLGRIVYKGNGCFNNNQSQITADDLPTERPEYNALLDSSDHEITPQAPSGCLVTAVYPGVSSVTFDTDIVGFWQADEMAYDWLWAQRQNRADQIKGTDYPNVIALLNSF